MSTLYPKHRNKAQSIVNKRLGTEKGLKSLSVKKQFQRIRDEEAKKYPLLPPDDDAVWPSSSLVGVSIGRRAGGSSAAEPAVPGIIVA